MYNMEKLTSIALHNPIYDLMILNEFQEHFNLMRKRQYQLKYGNNNLV